MKAPYFETARNEVMAGYYDALVIPEKLWHYTSSEGLLGIIQNHSLRFSDTSFVNDGSELAYGFSVFREIAENYKETLSQDHKHLGDDVIAGTENILNRSGAVVFCMSEKPNVLNQWRDYGADIVPYCIGLSVNGIQPTEGFDFTAYLIKIIYDQKTQQDLMAALMSSIYSSAKKIEGFGTLSDNDAKPYIEGAAIQFAGLILHYKNPAFEAEQEWRLVAHFQLLLNQVKPGYRTSNLGVVPFFDWHRSGTDKLLPITDVIVGPSPYGMVSEYALKGFLDQNGYGSANTFYSQIPIRR